MSMGMSLRVTCLSGDGHVIRARGFCQGAQRRAYNKFRILGVGLGLRGDFL